LIKNNPVSVYHEIVKKTTKGIFKFSSAELEKGTKKERDFCGISLKIWMIS